MWTAGVKAAPTRHFNDFEPAFAFIAIRPHR
jgi:hypothetical protein